MNYFPIPSAFKLFERRKSNTFDEYEIYRLKIINSFISPSIHIDLIFLLSAIVRLMIECVSI